MINANFIGISKYIDEDSEEYCVLLSINALDELSSSQLSHLDDILNTMYGEDSDYNIRTNKSIIKLNSYDDGSDYLLPCDVNLIIEILEIFAFGEGTNAFIKDELVNKKQLSKSNRKNLYCSIAEQIKMDTLDLKMEEEKSKKINSSIEKLLKTFNC